MWIQLPLIAPAAARRSPLTRSTAWQREARWHLWSPPVVTLLLHGCYTVVTLLLHCCYTVVTRLLQGCYTVVHCCYTVVHCCYTVIRWLAWQREARVATCHIQWCYSGVTVVLQWCHSSVTVVLQWCHSCVTVVLQWCHSGVTVVSQWSHNGVTLMLQWCYSDSRWHLWSPPHDSNGTQIVHIK
jgi:hypothetical protein